jgi:hypothetical protein
MVKVPGNADVIVQAVDQEQSDGLPPTNFNSMGLNNFHGVGNTGGGQVPFQLFQRWRDSNYSLGSAELAIVRVN